MNHNDPSSNLKMTNMILLTNDTLIYDDEIYLIMGSIYGDIHMTRYQSLCNSIQLEKGG